MVATRPGKRLKRYGAAGQGLQRHGVRRSRPGDARFVGLSRLQGPLTGLEASGSGFPKEKGRTPKLVASLGWGLPGWLGNLGRGALMSYPIPFF